GVGYAVLGSENTRFLVKSRGWYTVSLFVDTAYWTPWLSRCNENNWLEVQEALEQTYGCKLCIGLCTTRRTNKKLTQAQLAQMINEKPQIIQEYESAEEVFLATEFPTVHVVEPSPIIITLSSITAPVPALLGLGLNGEDNRAIVPIDQPASPTGLDTLATERVGSLPHVNGFQFEYSLGYTFSILHLSEPQTQKRNEIHSLVLQFLLDRKRQKVQTLETGILKFKCKTTAMCESTRPCLRRHKGR
nr:multiprotein-bridging factor 1a [Tanacetum cinerariifolium]